MRLQPLIVAVALGALVSVPSAACAQHSRADVARARGLYAEGLAAIDDGRWADALGAFTTSYELSGAAPALFNVALVLRGLGRLREARDTLDRLGGSLGDAADALGDVVTAMRAEAAARIAVLTLDGLPEPGTGRVLLDGAPLADDGSRPFHLELDPGEHALSVLVPGFDPFAWQGTVADGARTTLEIRLVRHEDLPLWPFLVGGGALVAVGAIILGVVLGTHQPSLAWPSLPHAI